MGSIPVGQASTRRQQAGPGLMVAVAQLVESRIVIPVVAGSSPVSHPNPFFASLRQFFWLLYRDRTDMLRA
jgi:hypothetical protein